MSVATMAKAPPLTGELARSATVLRAAFRKGHVTVAEVKSALMARTISDNNRLAVNAFVAELDRKE